MSTVNSYSSYDFLEPFTIIWADASSKRQTSIREEIQERAHSYIFVTDLAELQEAIDSKAPIHSEIMLISSGSLFSSIQEYALNNPRIVLIYIFCASVEYHKKNLSKFDKIAGIDNRLDYFWHLATAKHYGMCNIKQLKSFDEKKKGIIGISPLTNSYGNRQIFSTRLYNLCEAYYTIEAVTNQRKAFVASAVQSICIGQSSLYILAATLYGLHKIAYANYRVELKGGFVKPIPVLNHPRMNPTLVNLRNSHILALGGETEFEVFRTCEIISLATHKWSDIPSMVRHRLRASCTLFNNRYLYAIGGETSKIQHRAVSHNNKNLIERLDMLEIVQWECVPLSEGREILCIDWNDFSENYCSQAGNIDLIICGGFDISGPLSEKSDSMMMIFQNRGIDVKRLPDMKRAPGSMSLTNGFISGRFCVYCSPEKIVQVYNNRDKRWKIKVLAEKMSQ